jgi:hypothetical protein
LIFETPIVVVFKEDANHDGDKYKGELKTIKIANFASNRMQSFVSIVHQDNFESFTNRDQDLHKVLIFSDRKNPSSLVKHLSKFYNNKLLFGYVRKEDTELIQKFNVTTFPTILTLTDPSSESYKTFTDEISIKNLKDFFREYAYFKKSPTVSSTLSKL